MAEPPAIRPSGTVPRRMGRLFLWNNPHWPDLLRRCVAEVIGTWLMVFAGTAVVAAAVLAGAQVGLWQVAVAWAVGVSLAIYLTAAASGAHLNPAVSLAFAIFRPQDFPRRLLFPYWVSQLLGAVLAGISVLMLYGSFIRRFEEQQGVTRGEPGSQISAMMFGEYFPNPGVAGTGETAAALVSPLGAMAVEAVGTGILVLVIFALVDRRNTSLPAKYLAPVLIGLTVALLISMLAPLTQGGWNPARDFGPRLVSFFAGWGNMAIPGPSGGFWAYIAGPLVGGPLGAAVYEFLLRPRGGAHSSPAETVYPEAEEQSLNKGTKGGKLWPQ